MKIFSTAQVRDLDAYTIEHEPISSFELMERAADRIAHAYLEKIDHKRPVLVLAGPGNNGGDALVAARFLLLAGLNVRILLIAGCKLSNDCVRALQKIKTNFRQRVSEITDTFRAPDCAADTVIVDGLFGSGLSRTVEGIYAQAIRWINSSGLEVVSIDIPSGLGGESNKDINASIVKAQHTFTLQFPKLSFFLPQSAVFVGEWSVLDIGLHPQAVAQMPTSYHLIEKEDIKKLLKKRTKFSHKGTYGHCLLIAGKKDMAGAAILSSKAALRSGCGLVTIHSASCNRNILQTAIPEAIFQSDISDTEISEINNIRSFSTLAIGPGIGSSTKTQNLLSKLLKESANPCILDADALNILALNKHLFSSIPRNSILTPHPKEFERLFGNFDNDFDQIQFASKMAIENHCYIILKGANTKIWTPEGNTYINSTGNTGMATAGTGDVLTGILAGLAAQGYSPHSTALIGVYLHGLAADLALCDQSEESLLASDIIEKIGKAYCEIRK